VAERTFVLVLPGTGPEQLKDRVRALRQIGFQGALAGLQVPRKTSATTVLRKLAQAIQKAESGS
jgi:hypothetical protein